MHPDLRARTMVVDNVTVNRGVPASWNLGVDRVLAERLDWLVLCSAATRFNWPGGRDLIETLAARHDPDLRVIEGGLMPGVHTGMGWHLIAIRADALAAVGRFDPIYHPGYYEDNDWSFRYQQVYGRGAGWTKVEFQAVCLLAAHAIRLAKVKIDIGANHDRYAAKWNGAPGEETFATPYGHPVHDVTWCPPASDPWVQAVYAERRLGPGREQWTCPYDNPALPVTHTGGDPSEGTG